MTASENEKMQRALFCVSALKREYPEGICSLSFKNPLELLIAVRLSAQCTDERVNKITPALFKKYDTLEKFCGADVRDVEEIIRPCGFFRTKAADIVNMCKIIKEKFGGRVPNTIEALTSLPGVGRKTANLIMGDVYNMPSAVVADTHMIRIMGLVGLIDTKNPEKAEMQLRPLLPPEESGDFCHRLVLHGRAVCIARRPQCEKCCLRPVCDHAAEKERAAAKS